MKELYQMIDTKQITIDYLKELITKIENDDIVLLPKTTNHIYNKFYDIEAVKTFSKHSGMYTIELDVYENRLKDK